MKDTEVYFVLQSRGIFAGLVQQKGDSKMSIQKTLFRASVARNFCWTCSAKRGQ